MAVKLSAKTWGPKSARVLTVYIEADNRYEIEDFGYSDAQMLAHKRGFSASNDVEVSPIEQARLRDGWVAKIQFNDRWRGRSF